MTRSLNFDQADLRLESLARINPNVREDEIEQIVAAGGREVTLLGQNVTAYNWNQDLDFAALLDMVAAIDDEPTVATSDRVGFTLNGEPVSVDARHPHVLAALREAWPETEFSHGSFRDFLDALGEDPPATAALPGSVTQEILEAKIAEVEAGMKAIHPDARIDVDARFGVPGLKPEEQGEAQDHPAGHGGELVRALPTGLSRIQLRPAPRACSAAAAVLAGSCPRRLALVETRALPARAQSSRAPSCVVSRTASVSLLPLIQSGHSSEAGINQVTGLCRRV